MEFAGNLVPVLQSGEQPRLGFKAFRENRLAFTMRLRDPVSFNPAVGTFLTYF
jgi:ankyrin